MESFSSYSSDLVLNHLLRISNWPMPNNVYIALFSSDAGLEDNNLEIATEISGNNYSRFLVEGDFSSASNGSTSNTGHMKFATATADWGTVSHFALMDASVEGNVLMWDALNAPTEVRCGESLNFYPTSLTIEVR